jgi:hypothetical protein
MAPAIYQGGGVRLPDLVTAPGASRAKLGERIGSPSYIVDNRLSFFFRAPGFGAAAFC